MPLPNFIIVGEAKAGTTSLYHYLRQHPQVFMSANKEPGFFAHEGAPPSYQGPGMATLTQDIVTDKAAYLRLFDGVRDEIAIGEASTVYLRHPGTAERMHRHVPEARIVAILRDPASRVFSAFTHMRRDGFEPEADLRVALAQEDERMARNWGYPLCYRGRGFSHDMLASYMATFGRDRVRIYLYEDLHEDAAGPLADLYGFLGVDAAFRPDMTQRFNVSGVPRFPRLHRLVAGPTALNRLARRFMPSALRGAIRARTIDRYLTPARMDEDLRRDLTAIYRDDILRLQELIGRDLSHWLEPRPQRLVG